MKTPKVLIVIVGIALILGLYGAFKPSTTNVVNQQGSTLGSVTGPDNVQGYWNYNGFIESFNSQVMQTSTSTLCAVNTPNATSTLTAFYANVGKNFDSAGGTFYIATSSTAFATSTVLFTGTIVAGTTLGATTTVSWIATTTDTQAQKWTLPPRSYVIFDLKGKTSYNMAGKCYAEFRSFQ